ncbi:hypothetical protein [Poseidonibacter lekithochrous]|uniref:hypothetical protein n=1 Tax=Poseidonibacter lekithochrous TaxID=1904463 RepID=UPI000D357CEC|nr:hypothetical protein [Poseidonibacter lekithochrous]
MKKISELSIEEIESFRDDYYNSDLTVKKVLEKHCIDCHPSSVAKELPFEVTEEFCHYCNIYLETKAKNRSDYRSGHCKGNPFICPKCDHKENIFRCNCDNCNDSLEKEKKFIFKTNQDFLNNVITFQKEKEFELESMTLKDKLIYLTFLKYLIDDDKKSFKPINKLSDIPFSSTQGYSFDLIGYILGDILRFDDKSYNIGLVIPREEQDDYKNYSYYPIKCKYVPNIDIYSEDWIIESINYCSKLDFQNESIDEVIDLWKEIASNELLEFLYHLLDKFNLDKNEEYVGDAIKESIRSITENFSVSQGYSILWYIIEKISAKKQETKMSRRYAVNMIPSYIASNLSKRISGEWQTKSYKRNYNLPQSAISLTYFNDILKIGEKGFTEKPSISILREYHIFEEEINKDVLIDEVKELYPEVGELFDLLETDFNPEMYEIVTSKDDDHNKALKVSALYSKTIDDFLIEYHKMKTGKKYQTIITEDEV